MFGHWWRYKFCAAYLIDYDECHVKYKNPENENKVGIFLFIFVSYVWNCLVCVNNSYPYLGPINQIILYYCSTVF